MASDFPQTHPRSEEAAAGLPGVIVPTQDNYIETSFDEQSVNVKPRTAFTGDTKLADLPIESGNYRRPQMQTSYFARKLDQLGEVPLSGMHGVVVPLAQPSQTQGDPDYHNSPYLVRQIPSASSDDLGLIV